jgi:NAD(P)H-dependent FMN reductase
LFPQLVVGVGQLAAVDGQAAASDAVGEVVAQLLQTADSLIECVLPAARQAFPVAAGGHPTVGEVPQHRGDVGQRDAHPLGNADEGDDAQRVTAVAALVAAGAPAGDEALAFVEVQRRNRDAAALGQLPAKMPLEPLTEPLTEPFSLGVIVGSIREGRYGRRVPDWFLQQVDGRDDVKADLVDLADTPLPVVQQAQPVPTGRYPSADVRAFAQCIGSADAFVVVTPEYNHSFPGPLKLAIDSVHPEWAAKPVGFVSYGGVAGGLRAVEHLRAVFAELHAVTIRETVNFYLAQDPLDKHGHPRDSQAGAVARAAAAAMLAQLAWWAQALRTARSARPYGAR